MSVILKIPGAIYAFLFSKCNRKPLPQVIAPTIPLTVTPHPDTNCPATLSKRSIMAAAKGYAGTAAGLTLEFLKLAVFISFAVFVFTTPTLPFALGVASLVLGVALLYHQIFRPMGARDEANLLQKTLRDQFTKQFNEIALPSQLENCAPEFQERLAQFKASVESSLPLHEVRRSFGILLSTPSSMGQATQHTNEDVVRYLQDVALLFYLSEGHDLIEGHATREGIQASNECDEMATIIQEQLNNKKYYSRDSKLGTLEWAAYRPGAAHHSSKASVYKGLEYNCHRSNGAYKGFTFSLAGKAMDFFFGPCPTGDSLFEHAILPAMRAQGKKETRFNYQDTKKGEGERGTALHKLAEKNSDVLTVVSLNFDALHKNKDLAKTPVSLFLNTFKSTLSQWRNTLDLSTSGHIGYYIPEHALPQEKFDEAFEVAGQVYETLETSPKWNGLSEKDQREALRLATDGILSLYILRHTKPTNVTGACKEDIDRGPVENIVMRLFAGFSEDADHGAQMLQNESRSLVAGAFSRTRHTDQHRNPLKQRFNPLINLLSCIDQERRIAIGKILSK